MKYTIYVNGSVMEISNKADVQRVLFNFYYSGYSLRRSVKNIETGDIFITLEATA